VQVRFVVVYYDAADERPVQLQGVEREAFEVGERRVAGAEVVDRELGTDVHTAFVEHGAGEVDVLRKEALGKLQLQALGRFFVLLRLVRGSATKPRFARSWPAFRLGLGCAHARLPRGGPGLSRPRLTTCLCAPTSAPAILLTGRPAKAARDLPRLSLRPRSGWQRGLCPPGSAGPLRSGRTRRESWRDHR
jgi:hypothetical protein